jgi:hypothetical protein
MSGAVVGLFIFLLFGAAGAAYYFLVYKKEQDKKKKKEKEETSPSPTRESVLASGQALESGEIDTGPGKKKVTNQPVIADKSKVTYTLSMDINIVNWAMFPIRFLHNNGDETTTIANTGTQRRPEIWFIGSGDPGLKLLHININHDGDTSVEHLRPTFKATVGEYFNLTYVIDGGKCTAYINGVKDGERSADFTWSKGVDEWTWNPFNSTTNYAKVKNVYFFNKALTVSEIELIGKKPTSGTSTYTLPPTDNFASEPHSIQPFSTKMCDI